MTIFNYKDLKTQQWTDGALVSKTIFSMTVPTWVVMTKIDGKFEKATGMNIKKSKNIVVALGRKKSKSFWVRCLEELFNWCQRQRNRYYYWRSRKEI